jgi:hypothetical protein
VSTAPERKQPGRKPLPPGKGKTARIQLKVLDSEKAQWIAEAAAVGMTLNAWMQMRCNTKRR